MVIFPRYNYVEAQQGQESASDDRVRSYGLAGIVLGLIAPFIGFFFAVSSYRRARRYDENPLLGILGLITTAIGIAGYWFVMHRIQSAPNLDDAPAAK